MEKLHSKSFRQTCKNALFTKNEFIKLNLINFYPFLLNETLFNKLIMTEAFLNTSY